MIDAGPPVLASRTTTAEPATFSLPQAVPHVAAEATALTLDRPIHVDQPFEAIRPSTRGRALLKRVLETVPALVALTLISSLLWGPLFAPVPFAVALVSFHAYWCWRAHMTGIHAWKGFLILRRHKNTDWRSRYDDLRAAGRHASNWESIRHIVIIPNYTESADKLRLCLDSLAESQSASKIIAVLAMEDREGEEGRRRARTCRTNTRDGWAPSSPHTTRGESPEKSRGRHRTRTGPPAARRNI